MELIQIVPRLPPPEEGVGGTALALAGALAARGIATRFVVPAPHGAAAKASGVDVTEIAAEAGALARALESSSGGAAASARALLHYANYGYQARGCPRFLVEGLERSEAKLATHFHEVWATGPPWSSSFWLAPIQRALAGRVARRSERISTGMPLYAGMIRAAAGRPGAEIAIRATFSAIGEPEDVPPLAARAPRLVVFGGPGIRGRAYRERSPAIVDACRAFGLDEIWDIGPGSVAPGAVGAIPVRALGALEAPAVSAILAGSRAGFLAYPLGFLPKSSAFAAYAAHGLLPICAGRPAPRGMVPAPGVHFVSGEAIGSVAGAPATQSAVEAIAAAARSWYLEHSLARQAAEIAAWVEGRS